MGNIDQEVRGWSVFVATLPEQENQRFWLIRIREIKLDANMKSLLLLNSNKGHWKLFHLAAFFQEKSC